jgi:predicted phage terminase large subunit-like protein
MPELIRRRRRTVNLHDSQWAFRQSNALYRGFVGGRGAGKTWIGAHDLLCRVQPGKTYLVASPTYTILEDTTLQTFAALAKDLGTWQGMKASPRPNVCLADGITVRFRSAEEPDKLRGPNLSGVWLDEASQMHEDAYKICIASLREAGEQGWLSATFTPRGLTHWTYEVFGKLPVRPHTELFHAKTADNPFNPPEFAAILARQYAGQWARQELGGEFVSLEGAEWPAEYFPESIWFDAWPEDFTDRGMALDPSRGREQHKPKEGRLPDYSAFVWGGRDRQGTIWVDANLDQARDVSRIVEDGIGLYRDFGPSAFAVEINQFQALLADDFIRRSRELALVLPLYGINNFEAKDTRIRQLGPLLAQRRLRIRDSPGGRLLVAQLRDFPMGEYDDGPDALQMLLVLMAHLRGQPTGGARPVLMKGKR